MVIDWLVFLQQAGVCAPTCLLRVQWEGECGHSLSVSVSGPSVCLDKRMKIKLKCTCLKCHNNKSKVMLMYVLLKKKEKKRIMKWKLIINNNIINFKPNDCVIDLEPTVSPSELVVLKHLKREQSISDQQLICNAKMLPRCFRPQVTLFEQRNFAGRRLDLTSDCPRISDKNFPERCNSVQVESGA